MKSPAETLNFRQSLLELLEAGPWHEETLLEEFERQQGVRAIRSTPRCSTSSTHLNFTERQAARHWKRVVAHRRATAVQGSGRDPGLRVAILDYFVNVSHELKNPKVIEISIYERTERSAVTDGLTGLYNHAFFLQALRQEVLRSKRHDLRAALLLLDLDDFKKVNDERGHVEGDRVLMRAAAVVREGVREIDMAARYGGEEFAVLLPETSRIGAFVVAERIRRRIEERFGRGALAGDGLGRRRRLPRRRRDARRPDRAGGRGPLPLQGGRQEPHHAAAGRAAPLPARDLGRKASRSRRAPGARRHGSRTSPRAACW